MQLKDKTVVLTGAAGGMGELIATELAGQGARLVLSDINEERLEQLLARLGSKHITVASDLCAEEGRAELLQACRELRSVDVLINAAGLSDYSLLESQSAEKIQLMTNLNLVVPMLVCQGLLPLLKARPEAAIVNIGSTFGAIGHPGFAVYCASKFGLHGFTEALRRELSDTGIKVFYLAPRATQTDMNSNAVVDLNRELGNAMDKPEVVVASLMRLLTNGRAGDCFLGWPEKLFVRVNGLLPRIVDNALGKQLPIIKRFARQN
jgi:short-subunit dehydrogenase